MTLTAPEIESELDSLEADRWMGEYIKRFRTVYNNPKASVIEKKLALAKATADARANLKKTAADVECLEEDIERLRKFKDKIAPLEDETSFRVEKNECSRVHIAIDACRKRSTIGRDGFKVRKDSELLFAKGRPFVVRHDWYAAIGDEAQPTNDEIKLPYPHCIFEFKINGAYIFVVAMQEEDKAPVCSGAALVDDALMIYYEDARDLALFQYAWNQVKSICVALDAEAATRNVIRAPHALNRKREQSGKVRISDYEVIDLTKRFRGPSVVLSERNTKVRLHFRRGHWRHYETRKTWIRWCLVGDPDLGFVNAHYAA